MHHSAWNTGSGTHVKVDGSGVHVVCDGKEDGDKGILAGKDVLQILCSGMGKEPGIMKRNTLFRLFTESEAQKNTIATTSMTKPLYQPPITTSSPRKQRKAYKPSRVPPFEEEDLPSKLERPAITDDHDSAGMMMKTTHDEPIMLIKKNSSNTQDDWMMITEKKQDDSTAMMVNSAITHDDLMMMVEKNSSNIMHADDFIMKMTKGKRKKSRRDSIRTTTVCKNLACKAVLHPGASFCRRCSCCICKGFDDNKDPSLWVVCGSEAEDGQQGCGLSCHVECALQAEVAGVINNGSTISLDGRYCCQPCGKISSLIGFWKKQLLVAKDARRVDILCCRLLLSHRLLNGTVRYKDAHGFIDVAVKKLEAEVRLMTKGSAKLARCIVNRLSCNAEVQELINLALEKVDPLSLDAPLTANDTKHAAMHNEASCAIQFEDVCSSSMVVVAMDNHPCNGKLGYKLWHRRVTDPTYPAAPTCTMHCTSKKALVSGLLPLTVYAFRLVPFSGAGDGRPCEAEYCTKGTEAVAVKRPVANEKTDGVFGVSDINGGNWDELKAVQNQQDHAYIANDGAGASHSTDLQCTQTEGMNNHGGMEDLSNTKTSSTSEVQEGKYNQSTEGPSDVQTGIAETNEGIVSTRKNTCETVEPLRLIHPSSLQLEKANDEVIILNNDGLGDHRSPIMVKASSSNVMDGNAPFRNWTMQVQCKENDAAAQPCILSKRTVQGVERTQVHMNGVMDCSTKADIQNFELLVKVIHWLECQGHLKEEFRMKFLTWYSLWATEHEKRVVSAFIDTLRDSPASLAGQLVDAFQDVITLKRQRMTERGYHCR